MWLLAKESKISFDLKKKGNFQIFLDEILEGSDEKENIVSSRKKFLKTFVSQFFTVHTLEIIPTPLQKENYHMDTYSVGTN